MKTLSQSEASQSNDYAAYLFNDYEAWHWVADRLPKDSFMCIVKMYNSLTDEWTTGTGIFDTMSKLWEATGSAGEEFPVKYWRRCPEFISEDRDGSDEVVPKIGGLSHSEITTSEVPEENIKAWHTNPGKSAIIQDINFKFQSGNTVRAKIGGPTMCVTKVFDNEIECTYYANDVWIKERFPLSMMIRLEE